MTSPKISVVVPAFNSERFIERTLQSVCDQGYENLEIIVVDDGSKDNTRREVTENFPAVTYLHQSNKGAAAARNSGIRAASGEYIAFLDSDDVWLPGKLQSQMAVVRGDTSAKIVHTNISVSVNGKLETSIYPTRQNQGRIFESLLLQQGSVVCSTLLVKKECLDKIGVFDEELRTAEDVHLLLRLAYHYPFHFVDEPLVVKNHHDANLTNVNNEYFASGSLAAIEKIEQLFPDYSRRHSKVMRRALFLRARLKAAVCSQRGDHRNALAFLVQALNYDRTPRNFASLCKQALAGYFARAAT